MPTQPDSIDINQLRAQLEAIYENNGEPAPADYVAAATQASNEPTARGSYDVLELTKQAKSHSPEQIDTRLEQMATIGQYVKVLRTNALTRGQ